MSSEIMSAAEASECADRTDALVWKLWMTVRPLIFEDDDNGYMVVKASLATLLGKIIAMGDGSNDEIAEDVLTLCNHVRDTAVNEMKHLDGGADGEPMH